MKRLIILLALVLVGQAAYAQRQSYAGYMAAGDKAAAQQDHYSAYQFYRIALEFPKRENDPDALYKLGESANKARAYRVSAKALMTLDTMQASSAFPKLNYYLGDNFMSLGQYDLAVMNLETFLAEEPGTEVNLRQRAEQKIEDANWAIDELARERELDVRHLETPVNSEESDFGYTRRANGDVYFSSIRFDWERDTLVPARKLSKILLQKGGDGTVRVLDEDFDFPGRHVSHTAFNSTGDILFFSLCDYVNFDEVNCQIYRADVTADGSCNNVRPVDALNQANSSSRMPAFGKMNDGTEMIFFASDRPGGAGGLDLYMAPVDGSGVVGLVSPITALNTARNDATPFFYNERQTLYFATDGRFSFGGLDLYQSRYAGGNFAKPQNLGSPINSSYDDAYYSQFAGDERAYFSSTRQAPDAIYFSEDKEVCCYDIYSFIPDDRVELIARTYNKLTQEELLGATVMLCEITPDGPVVIGEITNLDGNDFAFSLDPGKIYELKATKDGYTKTIDRFDLTDPILAEQSVITRDLYLAPGVALDVFSFNGNDNTPLEDVRVELYEIAENGIETLVATKTNPDANDVFFNLEVGKNYVVRGTRDGFGSAEAEVDLRDYVSNNERLRRDLYLGQLLEILVVDGTTDEPLTGATVDLSRLNGERVSVKTNPDGNDFLYTVNLNRSFLINTTRPEYQRRVDTLLVDPQKLEEKDGKLRYVVPLYPIDIDRLLPVSVYFDNDHPNPRTYRTSTRLGYDDTYYPYYNQRETFIEKYTEGMDQNTAFVTTLRFEDFFNLQVKGGFEKLEAFATALQAYLENGNDFDMELLGFASPRAREEYNRRLSARRNAAVRNYFERFNGGVLMPYIRSGKLSFSYNAYGENRPTAETISDRLDDPRESVFSVIASLQRRVELGRAGTSRK